MDTATQPPGTSELESPPCPLCGGDDFRDVIAAVCDRVMRKPGRFSVQSCRHCGLVVTRPRPTAKALDFYYQGTYSGTANHQARALQTGGPGRIATGCGRCSAGAASAPASNCWTWAAATALSHRRRGAAPAAR